jgi:hypothetical protein
METSRIFVSLTVSCVGKTGTLEVSSRYLAVTKDIVIRKVGSLEH